MKSKSPQYKLAKRRARAKIKTFMLRHWLVFYDLASETRRESIRLNNPKLFRRFMRIRFHWETMILNASSKGYITVREELYVRRKIL